MDAAANATNVTAFAASAGRSAGSDADVVAGAAITYTTTATTNITAVVDNDANNDASREDRPMFGLKNATTVASAAGEPMPTTTAPYVIPSLALGEGTFVFTYLGVFLSYITPHDLPVREYYSGSVEGLLDLNMECV